MNSETVSYKKETVAPAKTFVNRDAPQTRVIAGVSAPDGPLITAVIEHAQRLSEPYLFNHAMRSWLFAEAIGRLKGIGFDRRSRGYRHDTARHRSDCQCVKAQSLRS